VTLPGVKGEDIDRATAILAEAAASEEKVLVVFAPNPGSATAAHEAASFDAPFRFEFRMFKSMLPSCLRPRRPISVTALVVSTCRRGIYSMR